MIYKIHVSSYVMYKFFQVNKTSLEMAIVKLQICTKVSNVLDNIKNSFMSVKISYYLLYEMGKELN